MRFVLMHSTVPTNGQSVPVWAIWTPTPSGGGPLISLRLNCALAQYTTNGYYEG
jgi:hypothetical protein